MKRFVIIFISLIVGYALYWCISDYNYRYNKINSIVGIYKLDFNHTDSEIYKDSIEKYNNLRLIFNFDNQPVGAFPAFYQLLPLLQNVFIVNCSLQFLSALFHVGFQFLQRHGFVFRIFCSAHFVVLLLFCK